MVRGNRKAKAKAGVEATETDSKRPQKHRRVRSSAGKGGDSVHPASEVQDVQQEVQPTAQRGELPRVRARSSGTDHEELLRLAIQSNQLLVDWTNT